MEKVKPGKYRHYKGKFYQVIGVAYDHETEQKLVVYQQLYPSKYPAGTWWIRPLKMFVEEAEVNGKKVPRFECVGKA